MFRKLLSFFLVLCALMTGAIRYQATGKAQSIKSLYAKSEKQKLKFIEADDKNIQYTGRIDFTNPKKPKFWASGVYIKAKFKGTYCEIIINDEELYGTSHNYLEIVIDDGKPFRIQTTGATNTIKVAEGLPYGEHTVVICKDTESGIGYLEFVGFNCDGKLLSAPRKPARKLEFIGDSITTGTGSDLSQIPCNKGKWHDQHNAYFSYGPITARQLNAQWHLTAVAGIGLIHSCCQMTVTMPEVFDKVNQRSNIMQWNFNRYQPDAVVICLGQNDGPQDQVKFRDAYVAFIKKIRSYYPKARIVCVTSPMGDANLTAVLKESLTQVVERVNKSGDKRVYKFFYSKSYNSGCDSHPDLAEHQLIANELSGYLKSVLGW